MTIRPALLVLAACVAVVGVEAFPVDDGALTFTAAVADALIGLSFVCVGVALCLRRPTNRTGPLLVAVGLTWALANLMFTDRLAVAHTVGLMALGVFGAPLAHVLLAFPAGRLEHRRERWLVSGIYVHLTVQWWAILLVYDPRQHGCTDCAAGLNLLGLWPRPGVYDVLWIAHSVVSAVCALAVFASLLARWRVASPPARRAVGPMLLTGLVAALIIAATAPVAFSLPQSQGPMELVTLVWALAFSAIPIAMGVGFVRTRVTRTPITSLVRRLGGALPPLGVRDALAEALGDPSLSVAYWVSEAGGYRDALGQPVNVPEPGGARAVTSLADGEKPLALLIHDPALRYDADLLLAAGDAARLALENERLQAQLRVKLADVRAARARLVGVQDSERRRIERDLHDGAQQTLVALAVTLSALQERVGETPGVPPDLQGLVASSSALVGDALDELRTLARGVYPTRLECDGLAAALEGLALTAAMRVEIDVAVAPRPEPVVEMAAYFVCCEALANAGKHAPRARVRIHARVRDGDLDVEVADVGPGGARRDRGTGLLGLEDRVTALGGRLHVDSPPGRGTRVVARLPCRPRVSERERLAVDAGREGPADAGPASAGAPGITPLSSPGLDYGALRGGEALTPSERRVRFQG